MKIIPETRCAH